MEIVHAMVRGRAVGKGQVQTCTSLAAYPTKQALLVCKPQYSRVCSRVAQLVSRLQVKGEIILFRSIRTESGRVAAAWGCCLLYLANAA